MKIGLRMFVGATVILLLLGLTPVRSADDWRELELLLPESTNAILAIDAERLFSSHLAKLNHWQESDRKDFQQQLTMLPPNAKKFMLATELELTHFEPIWEFAAMKLIEPVTLERIQSEIGGHMDSLAELRTLRTEREGFVVPYSNERLALIRLGARGWASLQARQAKTRNSPSISEYLKSAVLRESNSSQIVVALHLEDSVSIEVANALIANSPPLNQSDIEAANVSAFMSRLSGVVFSVQVSDKMTGKLELDFAPQRLLNSPNLDKDMLLVLARYAGCNLPEFADWTLKGGENSIVIQGELSTSGLKKVLSFLHCDVTDMASPPTALATKKAVSNESVTRDYVEHVRRMVDSLTPTANLNSLSTQRLWIDRVAKNIKRQQTKRIRPDVADMGSEIATDLMEIVTMFNNAELTASARSVSEAKPNVQWNTELRPYDSYNTSYGMFYRYRPMSAAQSNVRENIMHSNKVWEDELAKANEQASAKFHQVQYRVQKLVELAQVSTSP